jgi:serine protease Do
LSLIKGHPAHKFFFAVILWVTAFIIPLSPPLQAAEKSKNFDLSTAIIQVAKQNIPAVVHIEVTARQEMPNQFLPFENDPFFKRFFNVPETPRKFKREIKGLGSGMIIDAEGHILTNHHVAGGATKIEVLLSNGQRYLAKLIGADPKTDLAVIKIDVKEPLPSITFGDSDKVEVGEWVVAIGHPRGLDQTVTQGIISAKHRRGITDPNSYQDFLQTDAAINPGNSGGPLLNLNGEVIGVNAVIVSQSGGFEGIGFTIPSNMATNVAKALIAHGKVERGWIGVSIQELTPEIAKSLHLENRKGAFIGDVVKGGPAEKSGLRKNDLVIAFQGKEIPDPAMLRDEVGSTAVGREAKITILREGKKEEIVVRIESLESAAKIMADNLKKRIGIEVRAVLPDDIKKYGLKNNQGVVITWVDSKATLGEAGFEVDDIILGIENQPIQNVDFFISLMSSLKPDQTITLLALDHGTGNIGNVQVKIE